MKRTLREWKTIWKTWDINDDAELDKLFEEADIEEYWDVPCDVDLVLSTKDGNIAEALVKIITAGSDDIDEGIVLVKYLYDIPYEMGRPELMDIIESINNSDEDEEEPEPKSDPPN